MNPCFARIVWTSAERMNSARAAALGTLPPLLSLEDTAEQALSLALNDRRFAYFGGLAEGCVLTQAGALPLRVDLCAGWRRALPEQQPIGQRAAERTPCGFAVHEFAYIRRRWRASGGDQRLLTGRAGGGRLRQHNVRSQSRLSLLALRQLLGTAGAGPWEGQREI